jgi:class 3 adenylate cyclase
VAILNSSENTREVNIVGDGVWAVINTPKTSDIDEVFSLTATLNSLMKVLDYKLTKAGYKSGPLKAGIGASWGRVLMIKAGYSGSGLHDVVYMGDVVNHAAKLAAKGNDELYSAPIYLGNDFVHNLTEKHKEMVSKDLLTDCYTADAVNSAMNDWYKENCK